MESHKLFAKQTCPCLSFENNWGTGKGGALNVEDSDYMIMSLQDMTMFYEYGYSGDYRCDKKHGNIPTNFNGNYATY